MSIVTEIKTSTRELWSDGRGWILLAVSVGWALSIGVRFAYPTLVPFVRADFAINLTTVGLLLSMVWGGYALGHIPGGVLCDRVGEGNILVVSTVLSAGTILLVATAVNVWMLFAGTLAFGLATALFGPTRFTLFTSIYSDRAGSAIGLSTAVGSLGNAALPVTAAFIATYATWRLGFGVFAPLFVGAAIAIWITVPGRPSGHTSVVDEFSSDTLAHIVRGIKCGSIPVVVSVQITIAFVNQGFAAFYPVYLATTKGLSPGVAAAMFGLYFAAGAIIQPFSGSMLDRLGARLSLVVLLGTSSSALWILPFVHGFAPLVAITVLISTLTGCFVVTQTYITDTLPNDMQGTGLGILKAGWMLLTATSPIVIGALADFGYFNEGFLLLAVAGTVGLALSVLRL